MNVFIQRADGTFGPFNIYLFILSKMFAVGDELHQVSNQYSDFPYVSCHNLIEGLLECGFQSIFDGTATREQIRAFLFESDFGCVLQLLRQEFEGFQERLRINCPDESQYNSHLDSIRENRFIRDFKSVFEFILEQLRERPDLHETEEIYDFLGQMVEFLTVPPMSE